MKRHFCGLKERQLKKGFAGDEKKQSEFEKTKFRNFRGFGSNPFESIEIQGLPLPDNREARRDQNKTDLRKDFGSKIKEDEKLVKENDLKFVEKSGRGGKDGDNYSRLPDVTYIKIQK